MILLHKEGKIFHPFSDNISKREMCRGCEAVIFNLIGLTLTIALHVAQNAPYIVSQHLTLYQKTMH